MRLLGAVALAAALIAVRAQDADDDTNPDVIPRVFVQWRVKISPTDKDKSADVDGGKEHTKNFASDAKDPPDYVKVHFERVSMPAGCKVRVCGEAPTDPAVERECHSYSKYAGDPKTVDTTAGEDGDMRFGALSIDGAKVDVSLVVPDDALDEWDDKVHGVEVATVEEGWRIQYVDASSGTPPGRDAKPLAICGRNERIDAICHRDKYPDAYKTSFAVARLQLGGGVCTAWRVSADNLMLTNNHCYGGQHDLPGSELHFNYQATGCGQKRANAGTLKVVPERMLKTDKLLDFTLFTLSSESFRRVESWSQGGYRIGYLTLNPRAPRVGERIFIPQHGAGNPKEISITDDSSSSGLCNIVSDRGHGQSHKLGYTCDTVGGSSGSPVVLWGTSQAIGLHNTGGCPRSHNGGIKIERIWPMIREFFDGAPSTNPVPAPAPPAAVDCRGYWGPCTASCVRQYYVTARQSNGGACPPASASSSRPSCTAGQDQCQAACTPSCSGKDCGSDGCGGTCGSLGGKCYSGQYCSSQGICQRSTFNPPPAVPSGPPTCAQKTCNYILSTNDQCPQGYRRLDSTVWGCNSGTEECEYAMQEALRAQTSGPRSFDPPKRASSPWWTPAPPKCYVEDLGSGRLYLMWQESSTTTSGTSGGRQKAICRKYSFYGPGCSKDTSSSSGGSTTCRPMCVGKTCGGDGCGGSCGTCSASSTCLSGVCRCTPSCTGKECGSDGCGGTCGSGCNSAAGEVCTASGRCGGPTCGQMVSVCNVAGYKMGSSTKACTKNAWTGSWCTKEECCERRRCTDAVCSSTHQLVTNPSQYLCSDCTSSRHPNPSGCCFPKPSGAAPQPSCPADRYSYSYCSSVVRYSASSWNKYSYCNNPASSAAQGCMTSCHRGGYPVCGRELASAMSLAATKGGDDGGSSEGAGQTLVTLLLSILSGLMGGGFIGLLVGRRRSSVGERDDLNSTVGTSVGITQRLEQVQHQKMQEETDI